MINIKPLGNNYDQNAREDFKQHLNSAVFWFVVSSFGYYNKPELPSLLSDEVYDKLAKTILNRNIKHSKLSHLITEDDLRAGSLYSLGVWEYPIWVSRIYEDLVRKL